MPGQLLGLQLPGIVRGDADEGTDLVHHRTEHFPVVLVRQHTGEGNNFPVGQIIVNILHQRLDALGVVSAVDDKQGIPAHDIKTPGPAYIPQALADVRFFDLPAPLPEGVDHGQHHRGVIKLMVAQQRDKQFLAVSAIKGLAEQIAVVQPNGIKIRLAQRHLLFRTDLRINLLHLVAAPVYHGVAAGFDNTGLIGGNFGLGVAQCVGVIQTDVGDHGHLGGINGVGGIDQAAHAYLQHHDGTLLLAVVFHGQGRDKFKLRGHFLHGLGQSLDLQDQRQQLLVSNLPAVHLDALMEAVDVGGGEETGLVTGFAQNRGRHGGGAALAVGSGDVNEFQFLLRIAQKGQQLADPVKTGNGLPVKRVDKLDGLIDVHKKDPF